MALVPCPECKKEISNISKSCPNCGFPTGEYFKTKLNLTTQPLPPPFPTKNIEQKDLLAKNKANHKSYINFNNIANILLTLISLGIIGLMYYGVTNDKKIPIQNNNPPPNNSKQLKQEINYLKTTATKMINTYKNNEVRADNIYKDTYIEVTGIVSSIDSDLSNNAVINLASKNEYEFNFVMARALLHK